MFAPNFGRPSEQKECRVSVVRKKENCNGTAYVQPKQERYSSLLCRGNCSLTNEYLQGGKKTVIGN
jgi:hypothetical protein